MTNDEVRMTKQIRMTNDEPIRRAHVRHSEFVIDSSFWFRHSTFLPHRGDCGSSLLEVSLKIPSAGVVERGEIGDEVRHAGGIGHHRAAVVDAANILVNLEDKLC